MKKERPILFNGEMVRAILDGRKTQTRRIVRPQPKYAQVLRDGRLEESWDGGFDVVTYPKPPASVGDWLYVRETWAETDSDGGPVVAYRAGGSMVHCAVVSRNNRTEFVTAGEVGQVYAPEKWRPSIHMPRWASRITLEITSVRVQRLQDISEEDAKAEGVSSTWCNDQGETPGRDLYFTSATPDGVGIDTARGAFCELWDSIYKNWDTNPWVWVVEFRRLEAQEKAA